MKFFTPTTRENLSNGGNFPALFVTNARGEISYRVIPVKAGFTIIDLNDREEPQSVKNIEDVIYAFDGHDAIFYITRGARGLAQAMAEQEVLQALLEDRTIHPSDAMAMIGIAQDVLQLPIKVNGTLVRKARNHTPFYKMDIENYMYKEGVIYQDTYTSDISRFIRKPKDNEICLEKIKDIENKLQFFLPSGRVIWSYVALGDGKYDVDHMPLGYDPEVDIAENCEIQL